MIFSAVVSSASHLPTSPLTNPYPTFLNTQYTTPGTYTFTVPAGITSITVDAWGGGGRGGSRTSSSNGTGGGGGGAYSRHSFSVNPGESYVVYVGAGSSSNSSAGEDTWISLTDNSNALVLAKGGNSASTNSTLGATGGSASSGIGSIKYSGGNGADRVTSTTSGGGGSSAGTSNDGNNALGIVAGIAPSGGGNGGAGRLNAGSGISGSFPGGGGGGAVRVSSGSPSGGNGGHGQLLITWEICDNGIDDDGDGLIDELDNDCTVECITPDFDFSNPVLISGTNKALGSVYRFYNIIPGVDARVTYVSRSHSDIVLASLDEPAATNGGYDWAFQPIIDYNWLNPDGSMENTNSDKYITFKFEFLSSGTENLYTLPTFNMSAIDVDGNGVDIREFVETTGFQNYKVETPTTLTISNALKALGSLPAFDGVDETALTSMITFSYLNTHTVMVNYGGNYIAGSNHNDYSENRMNCLFFKCYEYNTTISCPNLNLSGSTNICAGQSAIINSNISFQSTKIKPINSYLCLESSGNNNNAVITQSSCNNTDYENWQFELVSGYTDRYFIKNLGSNLYIRPLNGGTSNSTNITQATGNDVTFHWELVYHSVGRYHVKHVQSGKYLDISGGSTSPGTTLIIYSFHGGTNQQFYIDGGAIPYPSNQFNYLWSNGATSSSLLELPVTTTTYSVSVTSNTNNCQLVKDFTVEVSSASASISGTNVICSGASTIFTATGGNSYLWSTGATSAAISVSSANTYTVTVTDELGCTATSSRTLSFYSTPNAPVIGTITQPTCTTPTGRVILSGLPSSGNWTITRSPGGTTYTGSGTTYTVTNLPVSMTYTFTVTNASLCTSATSANVVINAIPTNPSIGGANAVCVGLTANVTPNSAGT
ncbi:MAG: RICIN domain-containing protein, partial [Saprospiraceae bacterium]